MARTFRLRHLLPLVARRFTDSRGIGLRQRSAADATAALRLAGSTELQAEQEAGRYSRSASAAVAGVCFHPWARRRSGGVLTDFKRLGNRWARRATRRKLQRCADQDAPVGHTAREFWRRSWFD